MLVKDSQGKIGKVPTICPKCRHQVRSWKPANAKPDELPRFWFCSNYECKEKWNIASNADIRHEQVMKALKAIYKKLEEISSQIIETPVELPEIKDEEIPVINEESKQNQNAIYQRRGANNTDINQSGLAR